MNEDIVRRLRWLMESEAGCKDLRIAMIAKIAINEIERLRAPSVKHEAPAVMDADAHWAAGYEQAECDILDLLEVRAHDPWPDSQWPAANEVLMQMIAEIEANEHREWEDEP